MARADGRRALLALILIGMTKDAECEKKWNEFVLIFDLLKFSF